jgi:hypothetical protein
MKIKFYSDPGHGWYAVKRKLIVELGLIGEISGFSYQRGKTVYLEEDSDAPKVFRALNQQGYDTATIVRPILATNTPHRIRNYESFRNEVTQ